MARFYIFNSSPFCTVFTPHKGIDGIRREECHQSAPFVQLICCLICPSSNATSFLYASCSLRAPESCQERDHHQATTHLSSRTSTFSLARQCRFAAYQGEFVVSLWLTKSSPYLVVATGGRFCRLSPSPPLFTSPLLLNSSYFSTQGSI